MPMPNTNLVRPSRDGDQFHYLWAARRCLKLLSADSGLVAVSIEGPSPSEQPGSEPVEAGEELIDVAEYFGSEDIGQARLVRYMQLKHSTLHANDPWTASGLEKTIKGFARRYAELQKAHAQEVLAKKLEFCFVTNRPINTNVVETVCAQRDETKPAALAYATESYTLTKDERSNAESKSEGYLEVARAILTTSKADAKAYFNEAVEVVGKIGDENLARWDAILDLADRASRVDQSAPKTAYQFARCAELTYDYVVRDKDFAWNDTVVALCGLCPSSAVAILSRWRDRGFGRHEWLLPIAIGNLIERNIIDPRDALPLIGFRAQWDYHELLGAALARSKNAEERALASQILYRYAQFSVFDSSNLKSLQHVATKHGVTLERLADAIVSSERKEVAHKKEAARYEQPFSTAEESKGSPWNDIFATKDLATADGLSQAYLTFKRTERPWGHEDFFNEAMRRVPVGSEAGFIKAVAGMPEFSLYSLRTFLERVPESWKGRPAISHALANALKDLCRRYCMEVRKSRYYEVVPFELACSLAGVSQAEIVDVVLAATGETPDLVETSRLFSLVGLLAIKLTHDEALEALTYGLNLFNSVLEDKDGDGPWKVAFSPTGDIREAVAGYVWSALAAPEAVIRWEAARGSCDCGICRDCRGFRQP